MGMGPKVAVNRSLLPTAPRAARGPDFDPSKVPTAPPYTAFLGNLPYDISEDDIIGFFRNLKVKKMFTCKFCGAVCFVYDTPIA